MPAAKETAGVARPTDTVAVYSGPQHNHAACHERGCSFAADGADFNHARDLIAEHRQDQHAGRGR